MTKPSAPVSDPSLPTLHCTALESCLEPPHEQFTHGQPWVLQATGPPTPLLDTVNFPVHLKNLGIHDLKKLSKELRAGARSVASEGNDFSNCWRGFECHCLHCACCDKPAGMSRPPEPVSFCYRDADLIHTVAKTGGHLGSSLGVVELTLALHYVFNTPEDKIIWDVGHQAYIHKMLTGRRSRMHTIRQQGGLSGGCHSVSPAFAPCSCLTLKSMHVWFAA